MQNEGQIHPEADLADGFSKEAPGVTLPDVDFDLSGPIGLSEIGTVASIIRDNELLRHPSGVYVSRVPVDPVTGQCSLDHHRAEHLGYPKVDLLVNRSYAAFRSTDELAEYVNRIYAGEFPAEHFLDPKYYEGEPRIPQLYRHYDMVLRYPPKSVDDVAILFALIRPACRHLVGLPIEEIAQRIWVEKTKGYRYKKSAAYGVALGVTAWLLHEVESHG
ncbi:MAG: hypothetical protein D6698_04180 [Gammaproteobacteria bacterium]|nr:MAG: hypothetical protein D6698_04180 [Gammaproteobacteria bacterium]